MSKTNDSHDVALGDVITALFELRDEYRAQAIRANEADPGGVRWVMACGKESGVWAALSAIDELRTAPARKMFGGVA